MELNPYFTERNHTSTRLIENEVPSRLHRSDASLFDFSASVRANAEVAMGWTTLATAPPYPLWMIQKAADDILALDPTDIVLVGQGGSTQAAMTLTKLSGKEGYPSFHTVDYISPTKIRILLEKIDPPKTYFIVSSKSGTTTETLWVYRLLRQVMANSLGSDDVGSHFIAITDAGSQLESLARVEKFRSVLPGAKNVGGRFSALSTFGLLPAALVGIDIERLVGRARIVEDACGMDAIDNPAIKLASFLFDNLEENRDKFSLLTPPYGRVFGLWIEQLVAESLGKEGRGILPNIEIDPELLKVPYDDRSVITLRFDDDPQKDEVVNAIRPVSPLFDFFVEDPLELGAIFVIWEYAIAMVAYLMQIDPFTQPDVAETKRAVEFVLSGSLLSPPAIQLPDGFSADYGKALKRAPYPETVADVLERLFGSVRPGDYVAILSFIPFDGGRREALEQMRHCIASSFEVPCCLEIGPRYLHSTGQLHKGGPNNGVFLILSADEHADLMVPEKGSSLGELVAAQARGDLAALSNHGRRVLHAHLPYDTGATVAMFADSVCAAAKQAARIEAS